MTDPNVSTLATGSSATATTTVSFSAQTAGKLLLLSVSSDDYKTGDPSGWTLAQSGQDFQGHYLWWKLSNGSETSVQYTIGSATASAYAAMVADNIDPTPFDANSTNHPHGASSATTTAITPTAGSRYLVVASFGAMHAGASSVTAPASLTNSFTLQAAGTAGATVSEVAVLGYRTVDGGSSLSVDTSVWQTNAPQCSYGLLAAFKVASAVATGTIDSISWSGRTVTVNGSGTTGALGWNWGDGNTSTGSPASHTYSADGLYKIDLTDAGAVAKSTAGWAVGTAPTDLNPTPFRERKESGSDSAVLGALSMLELFGSAGVTFSVLVGTATASGSTTALTGSATFTGAAGSATAAGSTASMATAVAATFTALVGAAAAAGGAASLTGQATFTATAAAATASGSTASATGAGRFATTAAAATAGGSATSLTGQATFTAMVGTASAAGSSATMAATTGATFTATVATATASGGATSLTGAARFQADVGTGAASGSTASMVGAARFAATAGTATAAGTSTTITGAARFTVATGQAAAAGGTVTATGSASFVATVATATAAGGQVTLVVLSAITIDGARIATARRSGGTVVLDEQVRQVTPGEQRRIRTLDPDVRFVTIPAQQRIVTV